MFLRESCGERSPIAAAYNGHTAARQGDIGARAGHAQSRPPPIPVMDRQLDYIKNLEKSYI
jgi:hypothetical protein